MRDGESWTPPGLIRLSIKRTVSLCWRADVYLIPWGRCENENKKKNDKAVGLILSLVILSFWWKLKLQMVNETRWWFIWAASGKILVLNITFQPLFSFKWSLIYSQEKIETLLSYNFWVIHIKTKWNYLVFTMF